MAAAETWRQYRKPLLAAMGVSVLVWGFLLLAVMANGTPGASRRPSAPPVTVPFDRRLQTGSIDLPMEMLSKQGGLWDPEQIHLSLAGPGAVFVSWATHNATIVTSKDLIQRPDLEGIASEVEWGTDPNNLEHRSFGNRTSYVSDYPYAYYVSGVFHHTKLEGLAPDTRYFYRCGDSSKQAWSSVYNFTSPKATGPDSFPQRIGLIGDLGQTYNSSSTLEHVLASDPTMVWLVGDFTYSDQYTPNGTRGGPRPVGYKNSYQPRWDAWARLTQPVFASRLMQGLHGNHEIELDASNRTFQAYLHRHQNLYAESSSPSQHYYSFDIAGAHVIHLGSYAPYEKGTEQYDWLIKDLAGFSRARTPWLFVNFHSPWYHTYKAHYKEVDCHRQAIEQVLFDAGVDMVFAGHVHAYAFSNRVFNYTLQDCAPHHVVIGDGGNIESLYTDWVDTDPLNCPDPSGFKCPTFEDGKFCPTKQPDWSAYREPSFGHGILELLSPTEAVWQWHRNQDGAAEVAHEVRITRDASCPNQQKQ